MFHIAEHLLKIAGEMISSDLVILGVNEVAIITTEFQYHAANACFDSVSRMFYEPVLNQVSCDDSAVR